MLTNGADLACFAEECVDSPVEHGQRVALIRMEEMEQVTDEVGSGGFNILIRVADFLESIQCLSREGGAISVCAFWIIEAVSGFVAGGSVCGDSGETCEEGLEIVVFRGGFEGTHGIGIRG